MQKRCGPLLPGDESKLHKNAWRRHKRVLKEVELTHKFSKSPNRKSTGARDELQQARSLLVIKFFNELRGEKAKASNYSSELLGY